jgi:hypothetical protein
LLRFDDPIDFFSPLRITVRAIHFIGFMLTGAGTKPALTDEISTQRGTMSDASQENEPRVSRASRALQRQARGGIPLNPDKPLEVPAALQAHVNEVMPAPTANPKGVLAEFKAKRLTRKAALDQLTVYYDAQLDVVKTRLAETIRVRKAEATLKAEEFLQVLNNEHIEFLTELGLRNEDMRNRAFIKLNEQTTKSLREVENASWPTEMIDMTLEAMIARYKKFMGKLASDLEDK